MAAGAVSAPISSVWPSAGARAAASAPMLPPAPPRLSTTTCWPSCSPSLRATITPITSLAPPRPPAVVDHPLLAELLAELERDDTPDHIGGAAGRVRDDQLDGLVRVGGE